MLILAVFIMPWKNINWGKISWVPAEQVTVSGEAKTISKNQIASFNAGVSAVMDSKENAVAEVNKKVAAIINSVKDFGIASADIQTQNLNVYQNQETFYDNGMQKSRPGQWSVNNSIEVVLRDVSRASKLADLLSLSGATNVNGPNFRFDDTSAIEKTLYEAAMKDAKEKAELIAKASGRKIGKVLSVNDGVTTSNIYPMYDMAGRGGGGGGAPVEVGSGTVSKSITVSFELK